MTIAITRAVSRSITQCELTHVHRTPIDLDAAREQHAEYGAALARLGCDVRELDEEPDLPDAVFVEDTAIVLDEVAVITRPGASSRRPETDSIARALAPLRPVLHIEAPATLDGGDVLVLGRDLFVGASGRSSKDAVRQLQDKLAPHGYTVHSVPIDGCLHLKSAACAVGEDLVLVNPSWVDPRAFGARESIEIHPDEPFAANAVLVDGAVVHAAAFPRTSERLAARGIEVVRVDASELAKAEGGVTCCSLLVRTESA